VSYADVDEHLKRSLAPRAGGALMFLHTNNAAGKVGQWEPIK
jgi:hypothetical protein